MPADSAMNTRAQIGGSRELLVCLWLANVALVLGAEVTRSCSMTASLKRSVLPPNSPTPRRRRIAELPRRLRRPAFLNDEHAASVDFPWLSGNREAAAS